MSQKLNPHMRPKKWPAERIFKLRQRLQWTQEQFAAALSVSILTVSRWERDASGASRLACEKLEKLNGMLEDREKQAL